MLEQLNTELESYFAKWQALIAERKNNEFFSTLKPIAAGWKVADKAEYDRVYDALRLDCDKIVETWMNGRWIAKMHLKSTTLPGSVSIIKLMQRRPGSDDALGLDHVDFYGEQVAEAETMLKVEGDLKWTTENNDAVVGYEWISIWFDGGEAKLKAGTVVDIVVQELQELSQHLKA
jgi:hypothetical protein